MNENNSFLGFYISSMSGDNNGDLFREYIWGEGGIDSALRKLKYINYGNDIILILFKFYVNPIPYLQQHLKEIENYRKNEKSVSVPIIVTNESFFNKSEGSRHMFLKDSIFKKMDILAEVVKKKKLDINIELLKADVIKILSSY